MEINSINNPECGKEEAVRRIEWGDRLLRQRDHGLEKWEEFDGKRYENSWDEAKYQILRAANPGHYGRPRCQADPEFEGI